MMKGVEEAVVEATSETVDKASEVKCLKKIFFLCFCLFVRFFVCLLH
jgi:hypothetical protein